MGIRGLGIGALRRGWRLAPDVDYERLPGEGQEQYSARVDAQKRQAQDYEGVELDVRLLGRSAFQALAAEIQAAWAEYLAIEPGKTPEDLKASTLARGAADRRLAEAYRALCVARVEHPKTGADLGPVLERVRGITAETPDGSEIDLAELDTERAVEMLSDMGLLGAVGDAVRRGQDPTRRQRDLSEPSPH